MRRFHCLINRCVRRRCLEQRHDHCCHRRRHRYCDRSQRGHGNYQLYFRRLFFHKNSYCYFRPFPYTSFVLYGMYGHFLYAH